MKLFKQFLLIISFTFAGEIVSTVLNSPIPGSIIGMLLLFVALYFKVVQVDEVATVGFFLLDNLSVLFLPAGVGIMVFFPVIRETWWSLLLLTVIVTVLTMIVVGKLVQGVKQKFEGDIETIVLKEDEKDATSINE